MTNDQVSHPLHYNWHPSGVECATIAEAFGYNLGNAIKYIWRCDHKGQPIEDLQKAVTYLNREIDRRIDEANTADLVTKSVLSPNAIPQTNSAPIVGKMSVNIDEIHFLADAGNQDAQRCLAEAYLEGLHGLVRSPWMASLWRKAADKPRIEKDVVPSDPLAEMRARAEAGDWCAQCTLGDAYATGMEVAKDQEESDRWYAKASALRPTEKNL